MDLSLIPKLPPPESKTGKFVYSRKQKVLQNLRTLLIALVAILVVTRKLYLRSYATERLLWDDSKCMPDEEREEVRFTDHNRYLYLRNRTHSVLKYN